jgi:hypothetical protein
MERETEFSEHNTEVYVIIPWISYPSYLAYIHFVS